MPWMPSGVLRKECDDGGHGRDYGAELHDPARLVIAQFSSAGRCMTMLPSGSCMTRMPSGSAAIIVFG